MQLPDPILFRASSSEYLIGTPRIHTRVTAIKARFDEADCNSGETGTRAMKPAAPDAKRAFRRETGAQYAAWPSPDLWESQNSMIDAPASLGFRQKDTPRRIRS